MPSGLKLRSTTASGRLASGSFALQLYKPRHNHTHTHAQIAATAVHPWPWRSMTSASSTLGLKEGIKLLMSPFASPNTSARSTKQADPSSVWHAVDLQQQNTPSEACEPLDTAGSVAKAFKVHTSQQLQVTHSLTLLCITFCKMVSC